MAGLFNTVTGLFNLLVTDCTYFIRIRKELPIKLTSYLDILYKGPPIYIIFRVMMIPFIFRKVCPLELLLDPDR